MTLRNLAIALSLLTLGAATSTLAHSFTQVRTRAERPHLNAPLHIDGIALGYDPKTVQQKWGPPHHKGSDDLPGADRTYTAWYYPNGDLVRFADGRVQSIFSQHRPLQCGSTNLPTLGATQAELTKFWPDLVPDEYSKQTALSYALPEHQAVLLFTLDTGHYSGTFLIADEKNSESRGSRKF